MSDKGNDQMNLWIRRGRRSWTPTAPPEVPDAKPDTDPPADDEPPGHSSFNAYIRATAKRGTTTKKGRAAR